MKHPSTGIDPESKSPRSNLTVPLTLSFLGGHRPSFCSSFCGLGMSSGGHAANLSFQRCPLTPRAFHLCLPPVPPTPLLTLRGPEGWMAAVARAQAVSRKTEPAEDTPLLPSPPRLLVPAGSLMHTRGSHETQSVQQLWGQSLRPVLLLEEAGHWLTGIIFPLK